MSIWKRIKHWIFSNISIKKCWTENWHEWCHVLDLSQWGFLSDLSLSNYFYYCIIQNCQQVSPNFLNGAEKNNCKPPFLMFGLLLCHLLWFARYSRIYLYQNMLAGCCTPHHCTDGCQRPWINERPYFGHTSWGRCMVVTCENMVSKIWCRGAWERMTGTLRQILDTILSQVTSLFSWKSQQCEKEELWHEWLCQCHSSWKKTCNECAPMNTT